MEDFSRKADEIFDSLKAKGASKVIVISSDEDKERTRHIVSEADTQGVEVIVLTKEEANEQGYNVDELKDAHVMLKELEKEFELRRDRALDELLKRKKEDCERTSDFFDEKQYQREQMKLRSRYLSKNCRR